MIKTEAFNQIIQLAEKEFQQYASLPFAVCLVDKKGNFLRYNSKGQQLFDLAPQPTFEDNIVQYYLYPKDRKAILKQLRALPPGQWLEDIILDLKIDKQVWYIKEVSKAIWDEEKQEVIGVLSLMSTSSKSDRYHGLLNELPFGVFCLRGKGELTNVNQRFLSMYGYDSFEEVKNKTAYDFMNDEVEVKEMEYQLKEEGLVLNQLQEHRRRDGSVFTVALSAKAIYGKPGQVIGIEGIVEDISNEAIYFKMVDDVPIGLYTIRINEAGEHILIHCNQQFAKHLGAKYPNELMGTDIRLAHKSMESFEQFHNKLIQKDQEGKHLENHIVELKEKSGRIRMHEVHSTLLKDAFGNIIGRVGAERDITDYWETKQQLDDLTTDIGKVLHSYSSTLIHSKHSMEAVMRSFSSQEIFTSKRQLDTDKIFNKILQETGGLKNIVGKLLGRNQEQPQIEEHTVLQLERILNLIHPKGIQFDMRQLAVIRDGSIKIKDIFGSFSNLKFPKEWLKQIRRHLEEVLRLCSLITLTVGIDAILEMETTVNNLRSYILSNVKEKETIQQLDIFDIMIGVIKNMIEYASNRNIEIKSNLKSIRNVYIKGYETDLVRALLNILHNAIKYSWVRSGPAKAFIQVNGKADKHYLYLSVENWGVAITEKEIAEGLIFKVGYRGANSSDRRRPGTGLGLYDSKKVIEKHAGSLVIESKPSLGNPKDDYSKPFVTTVTIQLPLR